MNRRYFVASARPTRENLRASSIPFFTVMARSLPRSRDVRRSVPVVLASLLLLGFASVSFAADVDGPDCGRPIQDYGDAPEEFPVYNPYLGYGPGHFPTCLAPGPAGNMQGLCAP